MLRIYFLQQWFNLSDPAVEEALYDSLAMRSFVGIDLGREPVPDETTVCRFRHLLETHDLGQRVVIRQHAPKARDFINRRYRDRGVVDEVERAKNRTKSKVRARVEHCYVLPGMSPTAAAVTLPCYFLARPTRSRR